MRTDQQVIKEIERYSGEAHSKAVRDQWDLIDAYYRREAEIELPEAVAGETGDGASLERLFIRTNFAKTIINSTVTMALATGLVVYGEDGQKDTKDETYSITEVKRLVRYVSRYGAGWLHIVRDDPRKKYRIHKPHVARQIMSVEDAEHQEGVLVIQQFEDTGTDGVTTTYKVARWYEWRDGASVVRRDFEQRSGGWLRRVIGKQNQATYDHMPWVYVPNRVEDNIYEQSDVIDGIDIFKQYDALRTKFLKALEDESFRITFLSSVSEEVAKRITKAGGLQLWYAKNKMGEHPPELQSVPPADQRQFLDALKDLVDSLATVTRTSVLELNERPVQDIPAQTLRVLYGPQIERVTETVEHVNPALTEALRTIKKSDGVKVVLAPRLPISEDKIHQNLKGLLDAEAYSRRQMLLDIGKTPEEAERIINEALAEKKRFSQVDTDQEIELEEAIADAQPTPIVRPPA